MLMMTMEVEVRRIVILISIFNGLAFAQTWENINIQKQTPPKEECDLILVSHSGIDKGKKLFPKDT